MRLVRNALWGAVLAALLSVGAVVLFQRVQTGDGLPLAARIGGPFDLVTHDGTRLRSESLKGTPFAVFFGFTYCPDVCPTTMLELSNILKRLGPDADRMRYFFVSVDTERDTPEHLKLYLSNFDARIMGLTGTAEEIAAVARSYRAIYQKVPTSEGFTYNHTATMYLMDRNGRLASTISYQESEETQLQKLKRLINGN
ncbi:MAG: SCO family protein [Hyphomicrobiaceae bacterium]|nr:SCO family protein [Hyphomicrobiaceae bacterium]